MSTAATPSTGPKTAAGKAISSRNAFQHGLSGAFLLQPWEDADHFDELLFGLRDEHRPATPTEALLVEQLAQHWWLSQRALHLQELCFDRSVPMLARDTEAEFALYVRYGTTHERAFHKTLTTLKQLQKQRKQDREFVSQNTEPPQPAESEITEPQPAQPATSSTPPPFVSQNPKPARSEALGFGPDAQVPLPPQFVSQKHQIPSPSNDI